MTTADVSTSGDVLVPVAAARASRTALGRVRLAVLTMTMVVLAFLPAACAFAVAPQFHASTAAGISSCKLRSSCRLTRRRCHAAKKPPRMSYDGVDFPSDVGDVAEEVMNMAEDNPHLRETMKSEILTIAATSNRGQVATQEESDAVVDLVYQLEARNPTPDATNVKSIEGVWELVYSDTQPFRSSPFFMALGEVFGDDRERAETLFALHRAATSNGEIGRVRQTISESTLVSEIDLKVGFLPGIPVALRGTVVTKAKLTRVSPDSFNVAVEGTRVTNNNILSFLDGTAEVPLEQIYTSLRGSVPESKLCTYYLDENMRISRTSDDHIFVYTKAGSS